MCLNLSDYITPSGFCNLLYLVGYNHCNPSGFLGNEKIRFNKKGQWNQILTVWNYYRMKNMNNQNPERVILSKTKADIKKGLAELKELK
jgi:hypothetical protein